MGRTQETRSQAHQDSPSWLDELARLFAGYQLYLVGGSVRDPLLGRPGQDLDLTTDARPQEIKRVLSGWVDALWLAGERFGTVGLLKAGAKAEITTFRADTYEGEGRHPRVIYGDSISDDLARRDFTINALARDARTGELLDPFGGQQDLAARLVRFVGDPPARIREDPLRVLRAVRFCAQLGFELEPATCQAIAAGAAEIRRISWERIRDEYDLLLLSDHPTQGLGMLVDLGLAHHTIPELEALCIPQDGRYHLKDVQEHTFEAVAYVPEDKLLRWAALLHDIAKPATVSTDERGIHFFRHEEVGARMAAEILARLRQPLQLRQQVSKLVRHHLRIPFYRPEWTQPAVRRLVYDLGEHLEAAIELAQADIKATRPEGESEFAPLLAELQARIQELGEAAAFAHMRPLLDGHEVMALLGLPPGPKVGEVHRFLLNEQIEGRLRTKEEAREAVRLRFAGL